MATLGTGLDEMMRHVHTLRQPVVSMLLAVVEILVARGFRQASPAQPSENHVEAAQPMETDADEVTSGAAAQEAGPSTSGRESSTAQHQNSSCMQHLMTYLLGPG